MPSRYGALAAAVVMVLGLAWGPSPALSAEADRGTPDPAVGPSVFGQADRSLLQLLAKARQLLDQQRYAEAVRCLGTILDTPEDFFKPEQTGPVHRSLKSEAQELLGLMPARGRELYEIQYGARARQMLNQAAEAGDADGLAEVSRRFFHTAAGYEATFLLGLHHIDHGRPLAGALVLERLREASPTVDQFEPTLSVAMAACWLRSGMPERAEEALAVLRQSHPKLSISIQGRAVALFDGAKPPLDLLAQFAGTGVKTDAPQAEQWALFRGNPARNSSTSGSEPLLSMRWQVPTTEHPSIEALIREIDVSEQDADRYLLPGLHPLIVDDVVLMRTARTLLAVDFITGKRLWEIPVDDPFEAILNPPPNASFRQEPQLENGLRFRLWGDATYGRISSDGQNVFSIEDLPLNAQLEQMQQMLTIRQGKSPGEETGLANRLAAYDIRTGKLKWHVGGSAQEFGLPLAGAFFLGPPLPLMDQLFALADVKGEIRLIVLDGRTGKPLWSQQLAVPDRDILDDPLRRLAGIAPSYADGVLVCPTANRAIVAVELATRSLLWGYSYESEQMSARERHPMFFGMPTQFDSDPGSRWSDSSVLLADGRVVVTPLESGYVHCLNLLDGQLQWKCPRRDQLYVACVHQGKVIMVGKRQMQALDLATGEPAAAWSGAVANFPAGSTPSGMGFWSGDHYYVPLSNAAVMTVDLNTGRAVRISKSGEGTVPGNLVCYKGRMISQRAGAVEAFYQLDALRELVRDRLTANGDDAEALSLQGELLCHEDKLEEAVAALRRSLELSPDPSTEDLLRNAYFLGLRRDFSVHRRHVADIEKLIGDPEQRATFLRLMAAGLEQAGQRESALEYYLKLIDLDRTHPALESIDDSLAVRRDRWVQVRLAEMLLNGSPEIGEQMDRAVRERLDAARAEPGPEGLRRFISCFDGQPAAEAARRELVDRLKQTGRLLEAEAILLRRERSGDPAAAAAAVLELAEMLRTAGAIDDAAACYARLQGEFADVVVTGGKTGRELAGSLSADDPVRQRLEAPSPWPIGEVEVKVGASRTTSPTSQSALEYVGSRGPFFSDLIVELNRNPDMLVARDGAGGQRWQLSMSGLSRQDQFAFSRGMMRLGVQGHLLLVAMGNRMLGIDALCSPGSPPRVLWTQDIDDAAGGVAGRDQIQVLVANVGGMPRFSSLRAAAGINMPQAVSDRALCFMRMRNCVAIDPMTGETLWVRRDVRPDSSVFGDHEYIFIVPPEDNTATVLRAADGQKVGDRPLPPQRLATFGRRVLVWRQSFNESVLEMLDAWEGTRLWTPRQFAPESQVHLIDDQTAAVLEPGGRFVLVGLDDGRAIIDAPLEPEPRLSRVRVFRSPEQCLLVVAADHGENAAERRVYPIHGTTSEQVPRGRVYAFDGSGRSLWEKPATIKDQFLPVDQPARMPVLVFAGMVQERKPGGQIETATRVQALDKRTGRMVCDQQFSGASALFRVSGNPAGKTVEIQSHQNTITLTFTDRPLPPASEEATAGNKTTPMQAVLEALQKAAIGP